MNKIFKFGIVIVIVAIVLIQFCYLVVKSLTGSPISYYSLSNGLEILVSQDKNLRDTNIFLQVDVGSINDPKEAPGLAHLLEHTIVNRSTKYPKRNGIVNLKNEKAGLVSVYTFKEHMDFTLKMSDSQIMKAADMLVWALHDPLFEIEDIKSEIKIIEQEFKLYLQNPVFLKNRFSELATDKSFPEHQFFCGNEKTLSVDNIQQLLKDFHSQHFTPDRMKLVICSKKSIKEIKKIVELFNILPKKKSKELSLLVKPVHAKFSDDFGGKTIKYHDDSSNKNIMSLILNIPSTLKNLKYRQVEYFLQIIEKFRRTLKNGNLKDYISHLSLIHEDRHRAAQFCIDFELVKNDESTIQKILDSFYTFIHSQVPNSYDFESVKNMVFDETKKITSSDDKSQLLANSFFYLSSINMDDFVNVCEFNEEALQKMLDSAGDIKNWLVLVPTDEKNLLNSDEHFSFKYSNPESIKLSVDYSLEPEKKSALKAKSELISKLKFKEAVDKELTQKSRSLIHKQLENGEYTVIFDKSFGENCEVKLSFFSEVNDQEAASTLIFWHLLCKNIQSRTGDFEVNFQLDYVNLVPCRSIILKGKRHDVLSNVEWVMNVIKHFKPSEEEIVSAKKEFKEMIVKAITPLLPFLTLYSSFMNFINGYPNSFNYIELLDKADCHFYSNYYIGIQSAGFISETETKAIYEMTKSAGTKRPLECMTDLHQKKFSYKTFDSVNKGFMIAYSINQIDNQMTVCRKFALAAILKTLLTGQFFTYFRSDHSIAYAADSEAICSHTKVFLSFFIQSSLSTDEINEYFKKFASTIPEIIKNIQENELNETKENLHRHFSIDANLQENLPRVAAFMEAFEVYDLNIFELIKKEIGSITMQDLQECSKIFESEPIIETAECKSA